MDDLVSRLRAYPVNLSIEAADRIESLERAFKDATADYRRNREADTALLRQALDYILSDGDFLNPDSVEATRQLIAALRERLDTAR